MIRLRLAHVALPLMAAFVCSPLWAAEEDEIRPVIQVTASGSVAREPDRVSVSLSVETAGKTARGAAEENARSMARVIKSLKKADLPGAQIQTSGFHLSPRYDHEGRRRPEPVGYTASNTVRVSIDDVSRAGQVLDTATAAGANRVMGLVFGLRDPDSAYNEALARAMEAAGRQARVLAEAAGVRLGPVVVISTSAGFRPREMARAQVLEHSVRTPIEPGDVRTTATVTASFELH